MSVARGLLPANSLPWESLGLAIPKPKRFETLLLRGTCEDTAVLVPVDPAQSLQRLAEGWVLQLPPPHAVRAGAAWHEAGTPRAGITDLTACPGAWLTPHRPFIFLGRAPSPREKEEEEERGRRGEGKKRIPTKMSS